MFVDTHNHITWGVDDGLQHKDEVVIAIQKAKEDGILRMVVTPHMNGRLCENGYYELMKQRMEEVIKIANSMGVYVYKGNEVLLDEDFLDVFQQDKFYTLADSSYVLCEFPVWLNANEQREYEYRLEEVIERGYIPVIAHVERYFHNKLDLKRIKHWIKMGCVLQVNRTSILGIHGKQIKKNADILLRKRLIHIVASDAHEIEGERIGKLSDCYAYISKKTNKAYANLICMENPMHIVHDNEVKRLKKFGL